MDDIVAVDGEAAAGKSACELVAHELGYSLLSTGPIYRAATILMLRAGLDPVQDASDFIALNRHRIRFFGNDLQLDGAMLSDAQLHDKRVEALTPHLAKQPKIRELLLPIQRRFNGGTRIVAEGRDIGSVVFPGARVKVYLTAEPAVRAYRRFTQKMRENPGAHMTYEEVLKDLLKRDHLDKTRPDSPLVCVPGAIRIDTTKMTKESVARSILAVCRA